MRWGTASADLDASFGVDECAGGMGTAEGVTEVEHAEPEAGIYAGLGSGQAMTGSFERRPGADCGFGQGIAEAVTGVEYAW